MRLLSMSMPLSASQAMDHDQAVGAVRFGSLQGHRPEAAGKQMHLWHSETQGLRCALRHRASQPRPCLREQLAALRSGDAKFRKLLPPVSDQWESGSPAGRSTTMDRRARRRSNRPFSASLASCDMRASLYRCAPSSSPAMRSPSTTQSCRHTLTWPHTEYSCSTMAGKLRLRPKRRVSRSWLGRFK